MNHGCNFLEDDWQLVADVLWNEKSSKLRVKSELMWLPSSMVSTFIGYCFLNSAVKSRKSSKLVEKVGLFVELRERESNVLFLEEINVIASLFDEEVRIET